MSDINKKHEEAVRETRRKVASAVQERAAAEMQKTTGWKRIVWAIVLGAATLAGWYFSSGTSQNQPEPTEPPAAAPVELQRDKPAVEQPATAENND